VDEDTNYLFVAGVFGTARVYDAATGELLMTVPHRCDAREDGTRLRSDAV
jgi:hypothetical protein